MKYNILLLDCLIQKILVSYESLINLICKDDINTLTKIYSQLYGENNFGS